jgi:hypothetical protein
MTIRLLGFAVCLFTVMSAAGSRADEALASALEKVSQEQIAAFNREDAAATMGYAYSKSPAYDPAKTALAELFSGGDARAEQVSFHYVGHDDEFAVARVKVKVTAPGAPDFQGNVVDALMIFHVEGGSWKVWDSYLLGSELVP